MHYLDRIFSLGSDSETSAVFWDPNPTQVTARDLLEEVKKARNFYAERYEPGSTISMLLTASPACLCSLFGAWSAGLSVASIPIPARGVALEEYESQLRGIQQTVGSQGTYAESQYCDLLELIHLDASPYEGSTSNHDSSSVEGGKLLQFTSGTTSHPKAVMLPLERVFANAVAIKQHLGVRKGDASFSWLPWSHDMGLIGMVLTPMLSAAEVGEGTAHFARPEAFVQNPGMWMERVAEVGASITAGPDFAMNLSQRIATRKFSGDLSRLRCLITGAEPIRSSTISSFSDTFGPYGMSRNAVTPAYGLAEAALAVTIGALDEEPLFVRTEQIDPDRSIDTDLTDQYQVGCGGPIEGSEVSIGADGAIAISGPSLFEGYQTSEGFVPVDQPFVTRDLGIMHERQLFVLGRRDDLLILAGRKFFAHDIEGAVEELEGVHAGGAAAIATTAVEIVAEAAGGSETAASLEREIRSVVTKRFGVPIGKVSIIERGQLPKTSSGKKRRQTAAETFL